MSTFCKRTFVLFSRLDYKVQKCVSLLEEYIRKGKLAELMWQECEYGKDAGNKRSIINLNQIQVQRMDNMGPECFWYEQHDFLEKKPKTIASTDIGCHSKH